MTVNHREKMKKLLTVFAVLFISGCTLPHFPDSNDVVRAETVFNREVFSRGGRAVVVIEEQNDIASDIKLHGKLVLSALDGRIYTLEPQKISVFMLEPGTYKIETFKLAGTSGYLSARINYGKRYRGGFSIADGEVVYLGKIDTRMLLSKATTLEKDNAQSRKEIITATSVKDDLSSLPPSFLAAVQQQTGKGLTTRLMRWNDTFQTGEKDHE